MTLITLRSKRIAANEVEWIEQAEFLAVGDRYAGRQICILNLWQLSEERTLISWWHSPRIQGFWGKVRQIIPRLRLSYIFPEWDQLERTNSTHFRPRSVHSGPASCDDCGRAFPNELRDTVSSFPWYDFPQTSPQPRGITSGRSERKHHIQ